MFADHEDDEQPTLGPSARWYVVALVLLILGLTLSLLIGRSAAGQIDAQPEVASDGSVELLGGRVSVFVARPAYDGGAQCTLAKPGGAPQPLDYEVEAGESTIAGDPYVRVGQSPAGLDRGTYWLDCGGIDAEDVALTSSSGLGGAAGVLILAVVLGVGLTVLALMIAVLVAVLRSRASRSPPTLR